MEKIRRKLIIDDFVENTTFHGVFYVKTPNRWVRLIWLFTVFISAALIILSTVLMVNKYLRYESYIITEERDLDRLEDIPNLLVCSSQKLSIVDSILEYDPQLRQAYERNISELSSLVIDDVYLQQMRQSVIEANRYSLASCKIAIKGQLIDCIDYKRHIVFTFNGFCLLMSFQQLKQNSSFLHKETNLLNYFDRNEANIEIKFNSLNNEEYFYFQLSADCSPPNCVFNQLNNQLVFSYREKSYQVTPTYTEYSSSFNNKKCRDKNDETACHSNCLQRIVADKVKCHFTFNLIGNYELPYCSLLQVLKVETIIQNYSSYRKEHNKICDECLPNCKSLNFELKEDMITRSSIKSEGFTWNFNLQYKLKQIKHIEVFGYTDLLNFINGLWSLFLGISVLSIWEITELIYALLSQRKYFLEVKQSTNNEKKLIKKVKSAFHLVFHDTYLHGLKNIFSEHYSKYTKIRWLIVISLATVGFSIAVNDATIEYLKYNSNIEKTIKILSNDDSLMNRKISYLLCSPLVLVNQSFKDIYMKLDDKAKELLTADEDKLDIKDIISDYKTLIKDNKNTTLDENTIESYDAIYSRDIFFHTDRKTNYSLDSPGYYFDKVCTRMQINQPLKDWFDGNAVPIYPTISDNDNILSIYPEYQINQFILDSESFHITEKSWYKAYSSVDRIIPGINANLKHRTLLPSPFRPSCNQNKDYKQHECYQECFNKIIFEVFRCKVVFGESSHSNNCHPWMLPLIIQYEKLVLRNAYRNTCDHCKEPCDFFYYELDKDYDKGWVELIDNSELIKQTKILKFEDTLVVVISYFSLFYGASILAFIQILFNIISNCLCKTSIEKGLLSFFNQMFFLDLFSNSTTIHCAKYLSSKNRNDFRKLIWLIVIFLNISACIAYFVVKVRDYQRSTPVVLTAQFDNKRIESFKIDFCRTVYDWELAVDTEIYDLFESLLDDIELKEIKEFSSLNQYLSVYFDELKALTINEDFKELFEIKWSSLVNKTANSYFDPVYVSNGMEWKVNKKLIKLLYYNFTTTVHETGLIFSTFLNSYTWNIDFCHSVNVELLQNASFNNPFINLLNNQLSLYDGYGVNVYFENFSVSTDGRNENYIYKRIKSIYNNYDYRYGCINKENCVSTYKVLGDNSEHHLFLCNREFRDAVYAVFNCTPFMTKQTKHKPECSIAYSMLIYEIMAAFKETLFKCEFSTTKFPIEFDEFVIPRHVIETNENIEYMKGVDFNSVKVYEQKIIEEYDLLQLALDLSNWLNVFIGFSFITICELLFICFYQKYSTRNKNETVNPKY